MKPLLAALLVGLVTVVLAPVLGTASGDKPGAADVKQATSSGHAPAASTNKDAAAKQVQGSSAGPAAAPASSSSAPATREVSPAPVAKLPSAPPAKSPEKLPPPIGSHIKDDENSCLACHSNMDPKDKTMGRFYMDANALKKDVHYQKGVSCSDCHGGDASVFEVTSHQAKDDFHTKLSDIMAAPA